MILFFFDSLSNITSDKLNNEDLLAIFYDVRVVDHKFKAVFNDFSFGEDSSWVLGNFLPFIARITG